MIQAYNNKNLFYDFMYLYHFIQTISTFLQKFHGLKISLANVHHTSLYIYILLCEPVPLLKH